MNVFFNQWGISFGFFVHLFTKTMQIKKAYEKHLTFLSVSFTQEAKVSINNNYNSPQPRSLKILHTRRPRPVTFNACNMHEMRPSSASGVTCYATPTPTPLCGSHMSRLRKNPCNIFVLVFFLFSFSFSVFKLLFLHPQFVLV